MSQNVTTTTKHSMAQWLALTERPKGPSQYTTVSQRVAEQVAQRKGGKATYNATVAMTGWRPIIGAEHTIKYCQLNSGVGE